MVIGGMEHRGSWVLQMQEGNATIVDQHCNSFTTAKGAELWSVFFFIP